MKCWVACLILENDKSQCHFQEFNFTDANHARHAAVVRFTNAQCIISLLLP